MILLSAALGMGPWSAVLAWTGGGCDVCLIRSIGWVQLRLVRLSVRGPGLVVLAAGVYVLSRFRLVCPARRSDRPTSRCGFNLSVCLSVSLAV